MKLFTLSSIIFSYTVRTLSWLFPRNKKLWVFVGWHRNSEREVFADNAKYMFLYAHSLPHIRAVWIAQDRVFAALLRSKGYRAFYSGSLRGAYYSLRAGRTFVDAYFNRINWRYAGGSTVVQLWHGKGFKKSGHESPSSITKQSRFISPELFVSYAYSIASSPYTAEMMSQILRLPPERVLITGLPRNDILFKEVPGSEIDAHPKLAELFSGERPKGGYILYAPTFRRSVDNPVDHLDLKAMERYLETNDAHLVISLHPKYRNEKVVESTSSRITYLSSGYDIYPFIKHFNQLITDYSSLFIEFTLLDKHAMFFAYDLEEYKKTVGLYEDFERLLPGPIARNSEEVINGLAQEKEWRGKRAEIRNILFTHQDGDSAKRIAELLP